MAHRQARLAQKHRRAPYWTEAVAREMLEALERSDLSLSEFARQQGLSRRRLLFWRARLSRMAPVGALAVGPSPRGRTSEPEGLPFLPVKLLPPAPATPDPEARADHIELVVSPRRRLRVPPDFDEVTLRRLLQVLDSEVPC